MSSKELTTLVKEYSGSGVLESSCSDKLVVREFGDSGGEEIDIGVVWNRDILPHSWYQEQMLDRKKAKRYERKIRKAEARDIYHMTPKKLSKALTFIDLAILRRITPNELVDYDGLGSAECRNIRHMMSKNSGLTNFVSDELLRGQNYRYFFKLLKHLERIGNYNSFYCVVKAFQMQKLDLKRLNTLSGHMEKSASYFDMRQVLDDLTTSDTFLICPMDVYIKDVEESNRTRNNEVASMRFCRLVEILIKLQNQALDLDISHTDEHFLLSKFWHYFQRGSSSSRRVDAKRYDGQFLLI
ncbi:ras-specific guanine nucleotide-releasing factor [Encephalitozoon hellem]|nr:ras-specific guanine nucleotide-releasing factor [Encephalitozoon hellem]